MAGEASKAAGWLKAILGTVAGLFSGAIVMYLTPLVDRVVKPTRPMANFAVEQDGLTVTFHNRSIGGTQGWWDFGDSSPLESITPQQDITTHTYANPGDYIARLILRNLIGEESDRTVTLHLESPRSEPPAILAIDAVPVCQGSFAPATFRVTSRAKNAQLYVWDVGDDRPLEFSAEAPADQERLVTFWKPGGYMIKLAAVNGAQAAERSEIVYVNEPPAGTVAATLSVTDRATRRETLNTPYTFHDSFPAFTKDNIHQIVQQVPARLGYEIIDVRQKSINGPGLQGKTEMVLDSGTLNNSGASDVCLQLSSDRRSAKLTGKLIRSGKRDQSLPSLTLPVVLVQERRAPASRPPIAVTATLTVPGSALLNLPALPPDWVEPQRQLRLELHDGDRNVWQGSQLPYNSPVTINNRPYQLTAKLLGNAVRIDLSEVGPGSGAAAN